MSIASSNMSQISVMFEGKEQDLETVLRESFKGIQQFLNDTEFSVIQMSAMLDQDADYKLMYAHGVEISDNVEGMLEILKELKSLPKQILPKGSKEEKLWAKQQDSDRKIAKDLKKEQVKMERLALKDITE
jgi:hypothetical protein